METILKFLHENDLLTSTKLTVDTSGVVSISFDNVSSDHKQIGPEVAKDDTTEVLSVRHNAQSSDGSLSLINIETSRGYYSMTFQIVEGEFEIRCTVVYSPEIHKQTVFDDLLVPFDRTFSESCTDIDCTRSLDDKKNRTTFHLFGQCRNVRTLHKLLARVKSSWVAFIMNLP